ncbi:hypothetical protein Tsubulata_047526, partial [Turnera subulata]
KIPNLIFTAFIFSPFSLSLHFSSRYLLSLSLSRSLSPFPTVAPLFPSSTGSGSLSLQTLLGLFVICLCRFNYLKVGVSFCRPLPYVFILQVFANCSCPKSFFLCRSVTNLCRSDTHLCKLLYLGFVLQLSPVVLLCWKLKLYRILLAGLKTRFLMYFCFDFSGNLSFYLVNSCPDCNSWCM